MTWVKRLELTGTGFAWEDTNSTFFEKLFDYFPCLETLIYQQSGLVDLTIQNLISVLHSFGDIKNLSLSNLSIKLTGLESYDEVKRGMESNIYQEAVKIIDEKFPIKSTQIKISAGTGKHKIIIIKKKGRRPFLQAAFLKVN